MNEPTKPCPVCGKKMIHRMLPDVLLSEPPVYQYQWWCGEHGYQGEIERVRQRSEYDDAMKRWIAAQDE